MHAPRCEEVEPPLSGNGGVRRDTVRACHDDHARNRADVVVAFVDVVDVEGEVMAADVTVAGSWVVWSGAEYSNNSMLVVSPRRTIARRHLASGWTLRRRAMPFSLSEKGPSKKMHSPAKWSTKKATAASRSGTV